MAVKVKTPHQVNLVIWVNEGGDEAVRAAVDEQLTALQTSGEVWEQTDPDDDMDRGWHWHGLKVTL